MSHCYGKDEEQKKLNEKAYRILLYKRNENILDNDTTTEFLEEYKKVNKVTFPSPYPGEPTNETALVKELTDKGITYDMASTCGWQIKANEKYIAFVRNQAFRQFENYARFNEAYINNYKIPYEIDESLKNVHKFNFISKNNRKYSGRSSKKLPRKSPRKSKPLSTKKSPRKSTRKSKRLSTKKSPRKSPSRSTRKR